MRWLKQNKILVLLLFIGAFLRFYKIDFQSVWLDEIHTINESNPNLSISEMYDSLMVSDPHPPLYFLILHFLFKIFGYSTFILKSFSALTGVIGILAIYYFGKELMNKKVGLIAAGLTVVNYFQLYYSQEARMYSMLFLTTIISFYFLLRFIKAPSYKSALIHGLAAALMIYTHFFALFALFAQYLIMLFFVFRPIDIEQKFKKSILICLISGITTLLLYIPAIGLFIETTKRTSIWIPTPTSDAYTQIFKEFFGNSEIVLFLISTILVYYFVKLFNRKNTINFNINLQEDKQVFGFLFLFIWLIVTLIIPLISSFVNLPMIISRYFINILPVLIVLIATGIYYIKNNFVKIFVVVLIVLFSLTDIFIVKRYYKNVNKTQFREATEFIIQNNNNNELVVSSLGWYLPYFLNNEKVKNTIVDKPLDLYLSEIVKNPKDLKSFWYFDGHIRPFSPNDQSKAIIEQNFIVDKSIDLYDCYAKHFILKSNYKPEVDIDEFIPLKQVNGEPIVFNVETFDTNSDKISLSGWAYFNEQGTENCKIDILAVRDNKVKVFPLESVLREDVTSYFNSKYNLSKSGYKASLLKTDFVKGNYQIGILIFDITNNKKGLVLTDKTFTID